MFLRHFDDEQRKQLLIMAFQMMVADRLIRDGEKEVLEALKQELHVFQVDREEAQKGIRFEVFADRRSQMAAMLKLVAMAFADQEYHETELKMLVRCGKEFGFSLEDMKAVNEWGKRHYHLVRDAEAMIES